MEPMDKGIFEGLKVLDCASFIAAPAAATVLSDFGAEVIKIEPPGTGDPYRLLPKLPGYPVSQHNFAWLLEGRNKRSLALDLAKPEGREVLYRLAAEADVFITNFPPGVRKRLGITYEDIKPLNARLIYASFTGYGETGAEADKPGFDSNAYWARSGLMDLVRADENTTPARSIPGMGDHPCAMALYGAIVTALYKRERSGEGFACVVEPDGERPVGGGRAGAGQIMRRRVPGAAAARTRAERRDQSLSLQGRALADPVAAQ